MATEKVVIRYWNPDNSGDFMSFILNQTKEDEIGTISLNGEQIEVRNKKNEKVQDFTILYLDKVEYFRKRGITDEDTPSNHWHIRFDEIAQEFLQFQNLLQKLGVNVK